MSLKTKDAAEKLAAMKALLAEQITRDFLAKKESQTKFAASIGIEGQTISLIKCGRLEQYKIDYLMAIVLRLGHDIEIVIKPGSGSPTD